MQRQALRCPECDAEFVLPDQLEEHLEQVHQRGMPQQFVCPVCGEEFGTLEALNRHGKFEHPQPR
jgi:uncharacterized protein with PIN domain